MFNIFPEIVRTVCADNCVAVVFLLAVILNLVVPKNLDKDVVTAFERVSDEDALRTAKWLASEEGLFSGISTGANVWAALQEAKKLPKESIVVTVQPDRGDKYLSIFSA